jgi:TonB-dependent starch-binding outer membrane protein SusC
MRQFVKKRMLMILLFLCSISYSQITYSQKNISGNVVDSKGVPLIGVNIHVIGSALGTVSDINGNFTLTVPSENTKLQFTFVGYLSEKVDVGSQTKISVVLSEDLIKINEVVVVGYGTMKKSDLTGSVRSIKGKEIKDIPVRSATDALQGKIAGVAITSTSGSPGSLPVVHIRGVGSVNGTDPIYVVDGFPQGDVSWLSNNDIESMEVMKDASACAIYGSRGANGVIMVTTKKGTMGSNHEMKINLDMTYGMQMIPKTYDMMNASEFIDYRNLAYKNGSVDGNTPWITSDDKTAILSFLKENYGNTEGTNWQKEIFKNAATQNYNFSLSNGSTNTSYYTSLSYLNQDGVVKGADFRRVTWNNSINNQVTKFASLSANISVVYQQRRNVNEDNIDAGTIYSAMAADPVSPVYRKNLKDIPDILLSAFRLDQIDQYNPYTFYSPVLFNNKVNPVAQSDIMHQSIWKDYTFRGNLNADIDLTSWLKYRGSIHAEIYRANPESFLPKYAIGQYQNEALGNVSNSSYTTDYFVFDNYLTIDKKYEISGKAQHTVFMVGTSTEQSQSNNFGASKNGIVINIESQRVIDAATGVSSASGSKAENSLLSYFGRIFHSWNDRYMLTASLRYDGSSSFSSMHKWAFFPSASFAYVFSEEDFFKSLKSISLSSGKLRMSWGQVGNQAIDQGLFLNTYSLNDGYYLFGNAATLIDNAKHLSGGRSYVGNKDLKWETTEQIDIGTDLFFFDNKLSCTFDYFNKKTKGMLWSVPLPSYLGYPDDPMQNAGTVRNTGIELGIDYIGKLGDFGYNVAGNISTVKNKVLSLGGGLPYTGGYYSPNIHDFTKTEEGKSIGYFMGYKTNGIFQSPSEIEDYKNAKGAKVTQEGARPGDLRYVDVNEDGSITADDITDIGSPFPDFTYGFSLNFDYKGFDLAMSFYGMYGNKIMNVKKLDFYSGTAYYNAPKDLMANAWTEANHSNTQFKISTESARNLRVSDWLVEDGSFLRLQNIQLGYTVPEKLANTFKLKSCRMWIGASNLFTITNYSGMSPEIGNSDPTSSGIDIAFYPQARQFLMGLNIQF